MTLAEFISEKRWALTRFEISWEIWNKEKPDQYPLVMSSGTWEEQFEIFQELPGWKKGEEP